MIVVFANTLFVCLVFGYLPEACHGLLQWISSWLFARIIQQRQLCSSEDGRSQLYSYNSLGSAATQQFSNRRKTTTHSCESCSSSAHEQASYCLACASESTTSSSDYSDVIVLLSDGDDVVSPTPKPQTIARDTGTMPSRFLHHQGEERLLEQDTSTSSPRHKRRTSSVRFNESELAIVFDEKISESGISSSNDETDEEMAVQAERRDSHTSSTSGSDSHCRTLYARQVSARVRDRLIRDYRRAASMSHIDARSSVKQRRPSSLQEHQARRRRPRPELRVGELPPVPGSPPDAHPCVSSSMIVQSTSQDLAHEERRPSFASHPLGRHSKSMTMTKPHHDEHHRQKPHQSRRRGSAKGKKKRKNSLHHRRTSSSASAATAASAACLIEGMELVQCSH